MIDKNGIELHTGDPILWEKDKIYEMRTVCAFPHMIYAELPSPYGIEANGNWIANSQEITKLTKELLTIRKLES